MYPDLSVAPAGQMVQGAGAQLKRSVLYYLLLLKIEDMAIEGGFLVGNSIPRGSARLVPAAIPFQSR
jgi:hypothetical protein